ncbi:MAG: hypothetical protein AABW50_03830, partial [Nanoarchaeota archaeon]
MKKSVGKRHPLRVLNLILAAIVVFELMIIGNGYSIGNAIKSIAPIASKSLDSASSASTQIKVISCTPTQEICDGKDNDCDKLVDEGGVCEVELTGTLETIVVDDFENNKASYLYYLNVNGKKYELKFNDEKPVVIKDEVSVNGKFEGNKIVVDSLNRVSKTGLPPWPATLGEQKYIVVFLRYGNSSYNNNTYNFTQETFNYSNEWMINASYGKSSLNLTYFGEFIVPYNLDTLGTFTNYSLYLLLNNSVDLNNYDGIIVYHPNTPYTYGYSGMATLGKEKVVFSNNTYQLYQIWMTRPNFPNPSDFGILVHEMGHNFGLMHATTFHCGIYPNQFPFILPTAGNCNGVEYGDYYDVMGRAGFKEHYGLRNKAVVLKWLNDSNVITITPSLEKETYYLTPIGNAPTSDLDSKGIKMHSSWKPFNDYCNQSNTYYSYYLEYKTFNFTNNDFWDLFYGNETFYGLNISNISNGLLIKIGRENLFCDAYPDYYEFAGTHLISMHPNSRTWVNGEEKLRDASEVYAMLLEKETYFDHDNYVAITLTSANKSMATVSIKPMDLSFTPVHDGQITYSSPNWIVDSNSTLMRAQNGVYTSYLKFNTPILSNIKSAKLKLYKSSTNTQKHQIFKINDYENFGQEDWNQPN